ncbi:MAG TPA: glycosyltransferase [Verrucomicrobiae bacterium]|jgi:alpha-1,6-mannosyltransferase|nr:glycosyltransferase [Verrucomicrobiae bacterium]
MLDLEVVASGGAQASLDISRLDLPPRLRPGAELGVLDITEFFGETTGGVRTYLLQKARYVQRRPELRQAIVVPGARDEILEASGVRCYRLHGPSVPTQKPYRFMLATRSTSRIVAHERPDLIEVGSTWFAPWLVHLATRRVDLPVAWFYHSNFPRVIAPWPERAGRARREAAELAWRYVRRLGRMVRATLAPSAFVAGELERAGVERVVRVSLGVDLERFHPRRRERAAEIRRRHGLPEGPLAIYVGRLAGEKEVDLLLTAWPEVERRTGARLLLVGDGPARRRLQRRPGSDRVFWLPFQHERDRLADLLAAADLAVAPCSIETFGLSALEALASGTPLLSADRGGVAETVGRSDAGAVFASGEAGALAEGAQRLLQGELASLGAAGRRYAEAHHGWDAVLDRIFDVYRDILGS